MMTSAPGTSLYRYVALGDSTAVGVGASQGGYPEHVFQGLRARGVPAGHLNLGKSGATTQHLVEDLAHVPGKNPALVTLSIGMNDLWRMVPLEVFTANLRRIVQVLEATGADVLVSNLSDLSLAPVASMIEGVTGLSASLFRSRVDALNGVVAAVCDRPRFTVVDVCRLSREELPAHPEYFSPDGFHPSDAGYRRWAELLLPHAWACAERWMQKAA